MSNATPTWTYDAAGNRISDSTNSGTWSYDNLNRMTASPNTTYTNDVLGNRTGKSPSSGSSMTYGWDDLNRMTSLASGGTTTNYSYRADGMRVTKSSSSSSIAYRYDGQRVIEDVELNSSSAIVTITRNAIGGRGTDAISRTTSSGTTVTYPLYDAHGNNVGILSKSGSSWSLSDERTYDAWGVVRSGATTGTQKGRYCANIGHQQDDESGLIYMKARFYESTSGRFLNDDPARNGANWQIYCRNNPINMIDSSGKEPWWVLGSYLVMDLICFVADYFAARGIINCLAEGFTFLEDIEPWGWAGLAALSVAATWWAVGSTVKAFTDGANQVAFLGGRAGIGDVVLGTVDKLKKAGGPVAMLAYNMEIACWLGIIEGE